MSEKVYQSNPYIREITSNIIKKEYSNGKFYITLDRTIFYPHMSGGQPRDYGTINGENIIDVYEQDNEIIHVLTDNIIEDKVTLNIEWNKRFDHMQQHTGQHILSSAFMKLYNGETCGFHLGSQYITIDINIPNLSHKDIEIVEKFANQIVFSNFNIKTYIIGQKDVSSLPLRKSPSVDNNIRIVEIDNIDYSPCSGTHTRATGEVGLIKIRKFEKYKGMTRIEFVCGGRALLDYSIKNTQINNISGLLSSKDNECFEAANRLMDENRALIKEMKLLREELLNYKSLELLNNSLTHKNIKIITKIFTDVDFNEIRYISNNLLNLENTIVLFGLKNEEKCQFIMGKSKNIIIDIKNIFNIMIENINGKGGGNNFLVQGGSNEIGNFDICMQEGLKLIKDSI